MARSSAARRRAVGDDAQVDAGQRAAAAGTAARAARGGAARCAAAACPSARRWCRARRRRARTVSATSSPRSTSRCAPSTVASRRSASSCSRSSARRARAGCTHRMSSSAPSRCAERQARRTTRCDVGRRLDEREQPLADRLRRGALEQPRRRRARAPAVAHEPLGLDLLGDLAQRDLAQRGEVLDLEEVVQRRLDALGRDRPCRRAGARSAPRA